MEPTRIQVIAGVAYRWLIAAFVLGVLVQFFLAASGSFGEHPSVRLEDQGSWDAHRLFGAVLVIGGLVLLVVCLAWWSERIWLLGTFLLALLGVVQFVLAGVGDDQRWIGALHGANGGAILLLSSWLAYRAWLRDLRL
jgi:uncharacterized membrane protein